MIDSIHQPFGLLEGKVAVVSGAGRGIGKVIARAFVQQGAKVLAADFSGEEEDTAAELGSAVVACRADMTREADIEAMFGKALDAFGRLDASIHVAGNAGGKRGEEVTEEEYHSLTSVHLHGMLFCCKHAVRAMLKSGGGSIVNFSSTASINHDEMISPVYSAAKAGINSLTKSFAVRYGPQGIRANAIAPGYTLSEKYDAVPAEMLAGMFARVPLGRGASPSEQAAVAAFLASDLSSFLTGVTIPVDGGWTARLA
jgi:NAD(P)-dependent dehydrogenase (short-subunit alcohol dehydrogenase family)